MVVGTRITGAGLAHVRGFTELNQLVLKRNQVTDVGLAHLKGLPALKEFYMNGETQVTDAGLIHVQRLTALEHLGLIGAQVTGAGLEHLQRLTGLRSLGLQSTQVTDTGLADLYGLTSLDILYLDGTGVTALGWRKSGTRCRIVKSLGRDTSAIRPSAPRASCSVGGRRGLHRVAPVGRPRSTLPATTGPPPPPPAVLDKEESHAKSQSRQELRLALRLGAFA